MLIALHHMTLALVFSATVRLVPMSHDYFTSDNTRLKECCVSFGQTRLTGAGPESYQGLRLGLVMGAPRHSLLSPWFQVGDQEYGKVPFLQQVRTLSSVALPLPGPLIRSLSRPLVPVVQGPASVHAQFSIYSSPRRPFKDFSLAFSAQNRPLANTLPHEC